jgi:3-oxo-5-alpha-steroid 4-dehydrogenase 1
MELPGPINMAYIMSTVPTTTLPMRNYLLAGLYILHYTNRAVVTPLFLADSLSPIHVVVFLMASLFNYMNSSTIGGWLAGYGGEAAKQSGESWQIGLGLALYTAGLAGNILAEGHLRTIRRETAAKQAAQAKDKPGRKGKHDKVYALPSSTNIFFQYCLFPHYTLEWLEWVGYWMIGGWNFTPGMLFVINEITTMTPRAVWGRRWYVEKFGKDAVGDHRGAVLPRYWGIG